MVKVLDPSKSHGHDVLNIHMLKLFGESIYQALILLRNWSISDWIEKS